MQRAVRERADRGQAILLERLGPQYAAARFEPALVPPFMRLHSLPAQFQPSAPELTGVWTWTCACAPVHTCCTALYSYNTCTMTTSTGTMQCSRTIVTDDAFADAVSYLYSYKYSILQLIIILIYPYALVWCGLVSGAGPEGAQVAAGQAPHCGGYVRRAARRRTTRYAHLRAALHLWRRLWAPRCCAAPVDCLWALNFDNCLFEQRITRTRMYESYHVRIYTMYS